MDWFVEWVVLYLMVIIYVRLGIIVMLVLLLINFVLLLQPTHQQMDPSWIRDVNIDAGESKAVNFDKCRNSSTPAVVLPNLNTSTFNYTQNYNKTDFKLVPKVALAQLSYDFFKVANPQMGYRITLIQSSITNTSFKYTVEIVGVKVCGLHFMYIAVQHVYDPFYLIQVYPLSFSASDAVRNVTPGNPRAQTLRINYPNNYTLPNGYSPANYAFQAWILSYIFYSTTHLSINLTCSVYSTTQFQLNITVGDNFSLQQLKITTVLVDRVKIFEYTYSIYIDQIYNNQPGNLNMNITNLTTITDFTTQYFYRNTLSGLTANYILFDNNLTYFYFYQSSSNSSLFTGYGINLRTRSCSNVSLPYYFYQNMKCITACPTYYYTNTTYKYCIKCHYSCQNCNAPALTNACTSCQAAKFRQLVNSTICGCMTHYFENGTVLCANCHYTCLQCSNQLSNGCLSCDSTLKRILNNTMCQCMDGYYQNTTCIPCNNYCVTCSFAITQVCLSCNSTNNRTLDNTNTACICLPSYYSVTSNCLPCDLGCLNCTGPSLCSLCDTSAHFTLQSGNCQCQSTYTLINSTCILSTATCGNGIMQLVQQCDDDNLINGDGCSSQCLVQSNYNCINNASLYAYSLCYYSGNIALNLTYVYKVPLQNTVQLIMTVSAVNINQTALKIYLQTQTAVTFKSTTRLLSTTTTAIVQQTFSYNIATSKLSVSFNYNSDIDLSTLSLQFKPSLSNGTNVRYFYATPSTGITLTLPYNKLLTTYLEPNDLAKQQSISWVFLAMIILSWIYLIVAIGYKQSAMALQFFMVLQVTYQSLLQSGFIYDGWIGLIFFGKYTYGVNASNIIQTQLDRLSTIGLNIPLINTLNVTVGFCLLSVLIMLSIFIYQLVQRSRQQQPIQTKANNNKIEVGRQTTVQFNHSSYQLKKNVFLICMETAIVCVFITFRIIIISICLAIKQSAYVGSSLFPPLVIAGCAILVFLFYYKFFDYQGMSEMSYRRILSNLTKQKNKQTQSNFSLLLSNYLLKYHYLNIFILMSIFAIINSVTTIGSGMYLSVTVGAVIWWLVVAVNGNYLRRLHTVRAAINTICLIVTMITLLLQTLNYLTAQQNITIPLIGLSLLFVSLVFNGAVLIRIEYKRKRKRRYEKKKKYITEVSQIHFTDNPIQPNQADRNGDQINQSGIQLAGNVQHKQQKSEPMSPSKASSWQDTATKFKHQSPSNTRTLHKKQNKAASNIEQTANKFNIQEEWQQPNNEYNNQQGQSASKAKITKQLDFQEI